MADHTTPAEGRYIPIDTNQGWGIAGFVVLLAVACIAWATIEHQRTYLHPTNPANHAVGGATLESH